MVTLEWRNGVEVKQHGCVALLAWDTKIGVWVRDHGQTFFLGCRFGAGDGGPWGGPGFAGLPSTPSCDPAPLLSGEIWLNILVLLTFPCFLRSLTSPKSLWDGRSLFPFRTYISYGNFWRSGGSENVRWFCVTNIQQMRVDERIILKFTSSETYLLWSAVVCIWKCLESYDNHHSQDIDRSSTISF